MHESGSEDFRRGINENIAELGERFGLREEPLELICECGDPGCNEHVVMPAAEYERLRVRGAARVVAPGHEHGHIADRRADYVVVD